MHQEPSTPGTAQPNPPPSTPTPEDPREREPIHDPPVNPEHDVDSDTPVRQAEGEIEEGEVPEDPSPDSVVFDENRTPG
jgi:hypothetical protein